MFNLTVPSWVADCNPCLSYTSQWGTSKASGGQPEEHSELAGTKTFGKGSVNTLHQLKDGSGLYITTARWLTPKGRLIEGKGIEPDYPLELEGEDAIQWAIDYLRGNKLPGK